LYVLTSESQGGSCAFEDAASGREFRRTLGPDHAALLLIGKKGDGLAICDWQHHRWRPRGGEASANF
jgi:hypothetical protein